MRYVLIVQWNGLIEMIKMDKQTEIPKEIIDQFNPLPNGLTESTKIRHKTKCANLLVSTDDRMYEYDDIIEDFNYSVQKNTLVLNLRSGLKIERMI